jgi:hypothetical protein
MACGLLIIFQPNAHEQNQSLVNGFALKWCLIRGGWGATQCPLDSTYADYQLS